MLPRPPVAGAQKLQGKKPRDFPWRRLWRRRHEVSILSATFGAVGRYRGVLPRSKVSMMIMRAPQQGQGCAGVGGSSIVRASNRNRVSGRQSFCELVYL